MPKPVFQPDQLYLGSMKHELERLGFPLSGKRECMELSEAIFNTTGESISVSTLYRIFVHNNAGTTPYIHNLNVLAGFIGFADWFEFENEKALQVIQLPEEPETWFKPEDKVRSLLQILVAENERDIIRHFFDEAFRSISLPFRLQMGYEVYELIWEKAVPPDQLPAELCGLPIIMELIEQKQASKIPVNEDKFTTYISALPDYNRDGLRIFLDSLYLTKWDPKISPPRIREAGRQLFKQVSPDQLRSMPEMVRCHYLTAKYRYLHTFPEYAALPARHLELVHHSLQQQSGSSHHEQMFSNNGTPPRVQASKTPFSLSVLKAWLDDLRSLNVPEESAFRFRQVLEDFEVWVARV